MIAKEPFATGGMHTTKAAVELSDEFAAKMLPEEAYDPRVDWLPGFGYAFPGMTGTLISDSV